MSHTHTQRKKSKKKFFHHPHPGHEVSCSSDTSVSENIIALSILLSAFSYRYREPLKQQSLVRNGWRFVNLKVFWLDGICLLPHWPAKTGNYSAKKPGISWLFSCYRTKMKEKKSNKNKKELLHVCFCYCAPEESLRRHLAKERTRVTFI